MAIAFCCNALRTLSTQRTLPLPGNSWETQVGFFAMPMCRDSLWVLVWLTLRKPPAASCWMWLCMAQRCAHPVMHQWVWIIRWLTYLILQKAQEFWGWQRWCRQPGGRSALKCGVRDVALQTHPRSARVVVASATVPEVARWTIGLCTNRCAGYCNPLQWMPWRWWRRSKAAMKAMKVMKKKAAVKGQKFWWNLALRSLQWFRLINDVDAVYIIITIIISDSSPSSSSSSSSSPPSMLIIIIIIFEHKAGLRTQSWMGALVPCMLFFLSTFNQLHL